MAADVVLTWNEELLDTVRIDRTSPPVAARAMAIVHTAIYDAVNAIDRTHAAYLVTAPGFPHASLEAAAAAAAHRALVALFPAQQANFDAALVESLASVPDGQAEDDGVTLGEFVADQILAARQNDGATAVVQYTPDAGLTPGRWQPTPPSLAASALPQWPNVTPWTLDSAPQFRADPPPALNSAEYAAALNEVKQHSASTNPDLTEEQRIARFWANGPGTSTPPGHWNVVAQNVSEAHGLSLVENARLFAVLNIALADAAVVSWDAKYAYDVWRPVTAIRRAAEDGNPNTEADANWSSFIGTPNFPSYTSGHSTFSAAAATTLAWFFGTDDVPFTLASEDESVGERQYESFSEAAAESGISRVYGGIHFSFDNEAGLASGEALGRWVTSHFLQDNFNPDPATSLIDGRLIIVGSNDRDVITVNQFGSRIVVHHSGDVIGDYAVSDVESLVMDAGDGNDIVLVSRFITLATQMNGGGGTDVILGGSGNDRISGDDGLDVLAGNAGNDTLIGGLGINVLFGGDDDDTLEGGPEHDFLFGGLGTDLFRNLDDLDHWFQ